MRRGRCRCGRRLVILASYAAGFVAIIRRAAGPTATLTHGLSARRCRRNRCSDAGVADPATKPGRLLLYQYGKVGSSFISRSFSTGNVNAGFVRGMQKVYDSCRWWDPVCSYCSQLPRVIVTHDEAVAKFVLSCPFARSDSFWIWSVSRRLVDR